MNKQLKDRIQAIIDSVIATGKVKKLECDGATKVINYLLTKDGITHKVMVGTATYIKEGAENHMAIQPHYWIEIDDITIDLKSKMWFGDIALEGLFETAKSKIQYSGRQIQMQTGDVIYKILTR